MVSCVGTIAGQQAFCKISVLIFVFGAVDSEVLVVVIDVADADRIFDIVARRVTHDDVDFVAIIISRLRNEEKASSSC